jgi:putative PIN family toxin of toxin-antitoxin system
VSGAGGRLPKAILDTSVLIRGILSSRGPSGQVLDAFFEGAFDVVLSLSIVGEVENVLRRRHIRSRPSFSAEETQELVVALIGGAEMASGTHQFDVVSTDPKDNHIVSTALEAGADYIVTEDERDLLSLKVVKVRSFPAIQVVDAEMFLRKLLIR